MSQQQPNVPLGRTRIWAELQLDDVIVQQQQIEIVSDDGDVCFWN